MTWTNERVELLVKLWNDGYSASRIASEFGTISRNAVIGKVHRLGISTRPNNPEPIKIKSSDKIKNSSSHNKNKILNNKKLDDKKILINRDITEGKLKNLDKTIHLKTDNMKINRPDPRKRISNILQLSEKTCKWPIGDPGQNGFHFCGCETVTGEPYCTYHMMMAYNNVKGIKKRKIEQQYEPVKAEEKVLEAVA
jgi:GcrA cell cycle regulator